MLQFRTKQWGQRLVTRLIGQRQRNRTGQDFISAVALVRHPRVGSALAEYVLLVGLIAIIAMAAVLAFGISVLEVWTDLSSKIPTF